MNIVSFWPKLGYDILEKILRGGRDKVEEAGANIIGGHTIEDKEPKYGLAVTGLIHPGEIITNSAAEEGDKLVLTKPLGMGILATALKGGVVKEEDIMDAIDGARKINAGGTVAMREIGIKACTDITGFGFLGHLFLMLKASQKGARIQASSVPVWEKAVEFAEIGLVPGGASINRNFLGENISISSSVSDVTRDILFDPQTSGGLLICVPQEKLDNLLESLGKQDVLSSAVIGEVTGNTTGLIEVV